MVKRTHLRLRERIAEVRDRGLTRGEPLLELLLGALLLEMLIHTQLRQLAERIRMAREPMLGLLAPQVSILALRVPRHLQLRSVGRS